MSPRRNLCGERSQRSDDTCLSPASARRSSSTWLCGIGSLYSSFQEPLGLQTWVSGRKNRERFTEALARFEVLNYRWPDLPKNSVTAERTLDLGCHVQLFSGQPGTAVYAFVD